MAGSVVAAVVLILLGVAWFRYAERLDRAARTFAVRTGLRSHQRPERRPEEYRTWHVWGGGILLIGLGLAFLVAAIASRG